MSLGTAICVRRGICRRPRSSIRVCGRSTIGRQGAELRLQHGAGAAARRADGRVDAFWGGLWGIVLAWLLPIAAPAMGYWPAAIVLGALMTSAVALMVVAPLKGRPFAGGWNPRVWAFALSVNAAWGFGTGFLLRLLGGV